MALSPKQKQKVIKQFQTVEGDTGSPEVQIALLTERINRLTEHLKDHPHDTHSRRGLLSMIAKRRRLINFLAKINKKRSLEIEDKIGFKNDSGAKKHEPTPPRQLTGLRGASKKKLIKT